MEVMYYANERFYNVNRGFVGHYNNIDIDVGVKL